MSDTRCLAFKDLTVKFGGTAVLNSVSGSVSSREILAIVGPSGCGKTTLLNVISGVLPLKGMPSGTVAVDDKALSPKDIYYAVCDKALIESLSLGDNLRLVQGAYQFYDRDVEGILKKLHISNCVSELPVQLSSGEYKRALLACGIVSGAPFLLLDEPTSNLDDESAKLIASCLQFATKSCNVGIIVATHDDKIASIADKRIKFK